MATRLLPSFKEAMLRYWALPYYRWRAQSGSDMPLRNLFDVTTGDLTLLPDVPEFCPLTGTPASMHYVGPILWNPKLHVPPFVAELDPRKKTVYVSMGSTGKRSFFRTALEAFADGKYQVVMTTGEIGLEQHSLAPGFFVTDFAPGGAIMQRADVSLNHGGNGTIYQALQAGVPIVGVPTHADQELQLQLCERSGVGRSIPERLLTAERLRQTVDAVTSDPLYRESAERMARAIGRYGGATQGARLIVDYVTSAASIGNRSHLSAMRRTAAALSETETWPSS
jgi:MGT family glycosyltransferase